MHKTIILTFLMSITSLGIYSQSFIVSTKGGFAYASGSPGSDIGVIFNFSAENKFTKYFSIGINGKIGGTNYFDEWSIFNSGINTEDRKLDISNLVYAGNLFTKFSFYTSDEIILSIAPEVGIYWMQSSPVIYVTNKATSEVNHTDYNKTVSKNLSFGVHLEGQYCLTDKISILASLGWNNYNIGSSMNKVELGNDWSRNLNEKSFYLYLEVGIAYSLFGNDIWK